MYVFDTTVYLDAAERESFAQRGAAFVEQSDQRFAVRSIVITSNGDDFRRIAKQIPVRFVEPWP